MHKLRILAVVAALAALLSACAPVVKQTTEDQDRAMAGLEARLAADEAQLSQLRAQLAAAPTPAPTPAPAAPQALAAADAPSLSPSLLYVEYPSKHRFLSAATDVLWMPSPGAPVAGKTLPNCVVDVLFAGEAGDDSAGTTWLFVCFPVYDSPMDNRGWVREADTQPYTADTQKFVQGDVFVKAGTLVAQQATADATKGELENDVRGYIEQKIGSLVKVSGAGGVEFWVDAQYLTYPDIN